MISAPPCFSFRISYPTDERSLPFSFTSWKPKAPLSVNPQFLSTYTCLANLSTPLLHGHHFNQTTISARWSYFKGLVTSKFYFYPSSHSNESEKSDHTHPLTSLSRLETWLSIFLKAKSFKGPKRPCPAWPLPYSLLHFLCPSLSSLLWTCHWAFAYAITSARMLTCSITLSLLIFTFIQISTPTLFS